MGDEERLCVARRWHGRARSEMLVILLPRHGYREDESKRSQDVRELAKNAVCGERPIANEKGLDDQQNEKAKQQGGVYVDSSGYGFVEVWELQ